MPIIRYLFKICDVEKVPIIRIIIFYTLHNGAYAKYIIIKEKLVINQYNQTYLSLLNKISEAFNKISIFFEIRVKTMFSDQLYVLSCI